MVVELRELHLPISDVILVQYQDAQPGYTWDLYRSSRKSWGSMLSNRSTEAKWTSSSVFM